MKQLRCKKCRNLQFQWTLVNNDSVVIEIKCRSCNTFNYFTVNLASLLSGNVTKK